VPWISSQTEGNSGEEPAAFAATKRSTANATASSAASTKLKHFRLVATRYELTYLPLPHVVFGVLAPIQMADQVDPASL
jgi:hypothetical protein